MNSKTVSEFMKLHRYSYDAFDQNIDSHKCGCGKWFKSKEDQEKHFIEELKVL